VRSADCGTVLVADRISGRVLAIHAGWKGTVLGVVPASMRVFLEGLGHECALVAAIGPHIEACCFEVGLDVAADLVACSPLGEAAIVARKGDKARVDLRSILASQLEATGIDPSAVDHVPGCTVCDGARFFSFRRDGARSGRLLSAIVARGPQVA
jgi:YfiH family protein